VLRARTPPEGVRHGLAGATSGLISASLDDDGADVDLGTNFGVKLGLGYRL
jgi:hypothetical protein